MQPGLALVTLKSTKAKTQKVVVWIKQSHRSKSVTHLMLKHKVCVLTLLASQGASRVVNYTVYSYGHTSYSLQ